MRLYYILILTIGGLLSCTNNSELPWENEEATYEDTKMTLEDQERSRPLSFLDVSASYYKNFWGNFVVEGTIQNNASIATFKDPVVTFSFYSKTGTHLGDESLVWYEFIGPGELLDFEEKISGYDAATEMKIELKDAKAE